MINEPISWNFFYKDHNMVVKDEVSLTLPRNVEDIGLWSGATNYGLQFLVYLWTFQNGLYGWGSKPYEAKSYLESYEASWRAPFLVWQKHWPFYPYRKIFFLFLPIWRWAQVYCKKKLDHFYFRHDYEGVWVKHDHPYTQSAGQIPYEVKIDPKLT